MSDVRDIDDLRGMLPDEILAEIDQERQRADRLAAEVDRLREALEAARMPHQRNESDPWYTCPVAWREDNEGWTETCFQCDGKPCDHGCNCGADEQNAAIDRALAGQTEGTG